MHRFNRTKQLAGMVLMVALCWCAKSQAMVHTWQGPVNGNWSVGGNWVGGAPTTGEVGGTIVEFNNNTTSNQNIAGLTVDQIHFKGSGNTINGTTPLNISGSNLTINIQDDAGGNSLSNTLSLVLTGFSTEAAVTTGTLTMAGNISGTPGFIENGAGTVAFTMSSNTYGGNTTILLGTLLLNSPGVNSAVPGSLIIGNGAQPANSAVVKFLQSAEIATTAAITVKSDGALNFNNFLQSASTLTVNDGTVSLGTGTLTLSGAIAMTGGTISASSGGSISMGGNLTAISSATASASISAALNLNATRTFTINSGPMKPDLLISAVIGNGGAMSGLFKTGTGTLDIVAFQNFTYTGTTTVDKGVMELNTAVGSIVNGPLVIGNGADPAGSATLRELNSSDISSMSTVQIASSGVLDMNGHTDTVGGFSGLGQLAANGGGLTVNNDNSTTSFDGTITGATGSFRKNGTGTLTLTGNNPFTGTMIVRQGTLLLNSNGVNTCVQGPVTIGTGALPANSAILQFMQGAEVSNACNITVNVDGKLDLNGKSDMIGTLTINSGNVTLGAGTLTTSGLLTMFGGTVAAGGTLNLGGDVSASSTSTAGAVIGSGLALNATRTFTIGNGLTPPDLTITGVISNGAGTSGITKTGLGVLFLQGTAGNPYSGVTTIDKGLMQLNDTVGQNIMGNIVIGNNVDPANTAILRDLNTSDIANTSTITINSSGQFDLNGFTESVAALSGGGSVKLGTGTLTFGNNNSAQSYTGVISGTGGINKLGTGIQTFTGNNTLTGQTKVFGGTLLVNGSQGGSNVVLTGGSTLGGTGTVGNVTVTASTLAPGGAAPGQLSTGNITLDTNSTIALRLKDSVSAFDSLNVTGTVTLGNCAIQLSIDPTFAGGGVLTLINNDLADAVVGTSKSFTEGQAVPLNTNASVFSYMGGTGNDVVLTIANLVPSLTSAANANPSPATATLPVTFSVGASDGNNDTLTFTWNFGDGTQGTGSSIMHTYATPGSYTATVTINDGRGGSISSSTMLTVNTAIPATLQINAAPATAGVGQLVTFSTSSGAPAIPLTYVWNFGDGATGMGATVTHAYAAAGSFSVSVVVTDGLGGTGNGVATETVNAPVVGSGNDSDGDGFSDGFETTVVTNPADATSTLTGAPAVAGSILPLTLSKASIKLNFAKSGSDSIGFSGTLNVPAGFTLNGAKVTVDVSGVARNFALDGKGSAKLADGAVFKLSAKATKGKVAAQTAKFSATLPKGTFAATLASAGLTGSADAKGKSVKVAFTVVFNQMLLQKIQTMSFSAKKGKTGSAK